MAGVEPHSMHHTWQHIHVIISLTKLVQLHSNLVHLWSSFLGTILQGLKFADALLQVAPSRMEQMQWCRLRTRNSSLPLMLVVSGSE